MGQVVWRASEHAQIDVLDLTAIGWSKACQRLARANLRSISYCITAGHCALLAAKAMSVRCWEYDVLSYRFTRTLKKIPNGLCCALNFHKCYGSLVDEL